jgi:PKHD-type hydroxylase
MKYPPVEGNVSGKVDTSYRNSKIVWLPVNAETTWLYEKIIQLMKTANSTLWKFHVTGIQDNLQVSEYVGSTDVEKAGHYDWHMDMGEGSSTRKLSVSIQLTDENTYEGGDLEFMVHRSIIKAPREKGTVILFPSYLTHRVTKVTKGIRRSLVFWFHGPPFV